jgi:hypothetical protein
MEHHMMSNKIKRVTDVTDPFGITVTRAGVRACGDIPKEPDTSVTRGGISVRTRLHGARHD